MPPERAHDRLLRHPQPRRRALRRQGVPHHARRARRWRSTPRPASSSGRRKAADYKDGHALTGAPLVANGVVMTGIAGRRVRHARLHRRLGSANDGKKLWRPYTTAAEPARRAATPGPATPRRRAARHLADRRLRPRARPRLLGHRQRRPVERRGAQGRQPLYAARCWRSGPRPASSSGTTSSRPTTRTTTTPPRWCWPC